MNRLQIQILVEKVWNEMYPDRRPWKEIGENAKKEWVELFTIYERIRTPLQELSKGNFEELYIDERQ
jgi:hypothetical protein